MTDDPKDCEHLDVEGGVCKGCKARFVVCPGCSEAGGAGVAVRHVAPVCKPNLSFSWVIQAFMREHGLSDEDVAREFSAARSTVARWREGTAAPGEEAQKAIYARIVRRAKERALKSPQPASCTGIAAVWCPNCGDCLCPIDSIGRHLISDKCPLHSPASEHASTEWR